MPSLHNYTLALTGMLVLTCPGCNSTPADQPDVAKVTGIVKLDGQPLAQARVLFQPDVGRPSIGNTDDSGRYKLEYNVKTPGAKLGHHTVEITTYRPNTDPDNPSSPEYPEKLPARYHSRSELTADVKPGTNEIPFELTSK